MDLGSGARGEDYAALQMKKMGYLILERNYRCRTGEIDIIASDSEYIVFAEVKTRRLCAMVNSYDAVTPSKRKRILSAAQHYLMCHPSGLQPRFDLAAVTTDADGIRFLHFEYLENMFGENG